MRHLRRLRELATAHQGLPLLWIALTVVALAPIWSQRLLPHVDMPNHLALVRGWHNYDNPAYRISEFFDLRIRPVPYIGFYATLHWMMYAVTIETAYKIFLSAYVVLFPLSVLSLSRALGRSPWMAVMAFPLIFSQCWVYGFASYLLGLTLLVFGFATLIRYYDSGSQRQLALLFVLSFLTYFFHILPWACLGLTFMTLAVLHPDRYHRTLVAALALTPSLALAIYSTAAERAANVYFVETRPEMIAFWADFPTSLKDFSTRVSGLFPGYIDDACTFVLLGCVVAMLIWQRVKYGAQPRDLTARRLHALAVVFFFAYLALPVEIKNPIKWFYIAQRLPTFIMILLLLRPSVPMARTRLLFVVPAIVFAIVLPLKLVKLYRSFSTRNMGFIHLVQEVPIGGTCLVVPRGMRPSMTMDPVAMGPVYDHLGSWPMALRGGYDHFAFDQGVPIRPKKRLGTPNFWSADTFDFRQAPEYEYYLVRNPPAVMRREPALRVIDEAGEWTLFHRAHDLTDEP